MRFKFEETEETGTLYLSGAITKNDKSELLSLLEKTASMCLVFKIDISEVQKITVDNLEILENFADMKIVGSEAFSKNGSASH